ncbi:MAG: peptidoglycan bridge formation glycyltransferase FemA/FemB family protein [Bacteroidales bacterium]|nr:peptidoglycan bridge formation glycyltransferase FemA/FemB family protein [Bacteroidales bacterium]
MKYKVVTELTKEDALVWVKFVEDHPLGNFFQMPRMLEFYKGLKKINPFMVGVYDEKNKPVGFVTGTWQKSGNKVTGFFSSRIIIIGGPLIDESLSGKEEIVGLMLENIRQRFGKKAIYTEFRNLFDTSQYKEIFESQGFNYKEHLNYIVDTRDEKVLRTKISKSKIRQVNKSLKNNAQIIEPENLDQVKSFYEILQKLYHEKVKKPIPGWDFFNRFFEWSQFGDFGKILLIKSEDKIVGGIMCPIFRSRTIYELYIAGLDGESKDIYPSVVATWAPIDYAIKNNIESFDFLGAGSPESDYGVREFKSKFGGELVQNGRYIRINNNFLFAVGKLGIRFAGNLIR